jgi:hypothetical protein
MVYINEFLPNPYGKDNSLNEWIELYNDSNKSLNLNGFKIFSQNKYFLIKNKYISPKSFLVLSRKETGLVLNNNNGELKFFDPNGKLIQDVKFFGSAPENQSFSRFNDKFFFTIPTPGKENILINQVLISDYLPNKTNYFMSKEIIFAGIFFSVLITFLIWFIFKNYEKTKELFFE